MPTKATAHGVTAGILVLVLTGCGSTVQNQSLVQQPLAPGVTGLEVPGADGLEVPDASVPEGPGTGGAGVPLASGEGATPALAEPGAGAASGPATGVAPAAPGAGASDRTGGPAVTSQSRGVTDKVVRVGVITMDGAGAVFAGAGVKGAGGGSSQRQIVEAVFKELNRKGGAAGRRLEPVFHDLGTSSDPNSDYQAACAKFSEDTPVFAAIVIPGARPQLYDCLRKNGIVSLGSSDDYVLDESFMRKQDTYFAPESLALDTFAATYPVALKDMGFFSPDAKIGVIYASSAIETKTYAQVLKPTLAKLGLKVTSEAQVRAETADYSPVVLRFRSDGVTHVLYHGAASGVLFMLAAENQQYRPKHGLHSRQGPRILQETVPAAQLRGSLSVGWQPASDLDPTRWPKPGPAGFVRCQKAMTEAGIDVSDTLSGYVAQLTCANGFFLADTIARSSAYSPAAFRVAGESWGADRTSVSTFGQRLDARHHSGVSLYRKSPFKDDCRCFVYEGAPKPLRTLQ